MSSIFVQMQKSILSALSTSALVRNEFSNFADISQPFKLLSVGKASLPMLRAIPRLHLSNCIESLVLSPLDNYAQKDLLPNVLYGNHPIPNLESFHSSNRVLQFLDSKPKTPLVVLISGGTSALLSKAPSKFQNILKSELHKTLITSGLPINQINTIRRHFSSIKGGKLLQKNLNNNNKTIVLAISDVPSAHAHDIGSGPFSPDPTSYSDALHIAQSIPNFPKQVMKYFADGLSNKQAENLKPDEIPANAYTYNVLLDQQKAYVIIAQILQKNHFQYEQTKLETLLSKITVSRKSNLRQNCWYIAIGEHEIKLPLNCKGKGGRITHSLLTLASKLFQAQQSFDIIGIATDGNDGSSASGGGFISSEFLTTILHTQMEQSIRNFNSAKFMDTYQLLFPLSPAQTNIGDVFLFRLR